MPLEMIAQYFISWLPILLGYPSGAVTGRAASFGVFQLRAHGDVRLKEPWDRTIGFGADRSANEIDDLPWALRPECQVECLWWSRPPAVVASCRVSICSRASVGYSANTSFLGSDSF